MDTNVKTSACAPMEVGARMDRFTSIFHKKIILILLTLFLVLSGQKLFAQGVGISETTIVPHSSAILELKHTAGTFKGFLTPRMAEVDRDGIASPATGLIIYNTTTNKLNIYDGTAWRVLFSGTIGINDVIGTADRISIDKTDPANPIIDIATTYVGQTSITTLGTLTTGTWNASTIEVPYGGTGLTDVPANNLLYGNDAGALNLLAPNGTTGTILMNTAAGAPSWSTLDALPATAGILNTVNGGTGQSTYTNGQLLIGNTAGSLTRTTLTGTANQVIVNNGDGSITLSTPQDIHVGASPTFVGLTLSGLSPNAGVYTDGSSVLTSTPPSTGTIGYWDRTGTVLSPSNAGDDITTTGDISTTGTGTITSAGLITAQSGIDVTSGDVDIADNLNVATNTDITGTLNADGVVTLAATGVATTVEGTLQVDEATTLSDNLTVADGATATNINNNTINIGNAATDVVDITGITNINGGNLTVDAPQSDINSDAINIGNAATDVIDITGETNLNGGSVTVASDLTLAAGETVNDITAVLDAVGDDTTLPTEKAVRDAISASVTADNGLNEDPDGNIQLGGPLLEATTITNNGFDLTLAGNTGNVIFDQEGLITAGNGIDVTAGDVDITDNLNVATNADITGTLNADGVVTLATTGVATTVEGTLQVDEATTLSDNLTVADGATATNINNNTINIGNAATDVVDITGITNINGGNLTVDAPQSDINSDAINIGNAATDVIDITGETNLNGGSVTVASDLTLAAGETVNDITAVLDAVGDDTTLPTEKAVRDAISASVTADNGLNEDPDGNIQLGGPLLEATTITNNGFDLTLAGNTGNVIFDQEGLITAGNGIDVTAGDVDITDNLNVATNTDITGNLNADGVITLAATGVATTVEGTLQVDEATTLNDNLTVADGATATNINNNTINIGNAATDVVDITGITNINGGNLTVDAPQSDINSDAINIGNAATDVIDITGETNLNGGSVTVASDLTLAAGETVNDITAVLDAVGDDTTLPTEKAVRDAISASVTADNGLNEDPDGNIQLGGPLLEATTITNNGFDLTLAGNTGNVIFDQEGLITAGNGIDVTAGDVDITDNLNVATNTDITGNLNADGVITLAATGVATTVEGTLQVDEATTLSDNLTVADGATATNINNNTINIGNAATDVVDITGITNINGGNLTVDAPQSDINSDAINIGNAATDVIDITGETNLNGGSVTVASDLTLAAGETVNDITAVLDAVGDDTTLPTEKAVRDAISASVTADNGLNEDPDGNIQLGGPLLEATTITNNGFDLTLAGNTGNVIFDQEGLITAGNGIDVTAGDVDITDNLNVATNTDITGTLNADGVVTLAATGVATTVEGTLQVDEATTLSDNLTVADGATATNINNNTINIGNAATDVVDITGITNINGGNLTVDAPQSDINSDAINIGNAATDVIDITGETNLNGGSVTVASDLTLAAGETVNDITAVLDAVGDDTTLPTEKAVRDAISASVTADNGLNEDPDGNIQLGGPLLEATTITNNGFDLTLAGNTGNVIFDQEGLITAGNGIDVTAGDVDITDNLNVATNTDITGNLNADGVITLAATGVATTVEGTLQVDEATTLSDNLTVADGATATNINNNTINIGNAATDVVDITGITNINGGNLTVDAPQSDINSDAINIGNAATDVIDITGETNLNGGSVTVASDLTLAAGETVNDITAVLDAVGDDTTLPTEKAVRDAISASVTADNGLNEDPDGNIQLGGPLLEATTITNNGFDLTLAGNTGNVIFDQEGLITAGNGIDVTAGDVDITDNLNVTGNTSLGAITSGTWNGTIIASQYGGTGVDNGANTITIGGNINTADAFSTVGANALTLTTTGVTDVTLPTTGTLATLNGTETLTNKTIAAGDNTITGLTNANLSGAAAITNANLANSDITIGTTAIDLGASSTTLAGLTSVTSTDFVGDLTGDVSGNATTATTATNIAGGVAGGVPYQTGIGATSLTAAGTAGQVLTSNGAGAPTWETPTVGTVTSVSGTLNRIDIDNTDAANPIVDIDANYAGQNTITTLGTVTTGTWNADIITGAYGGTGVDNGANTITIGGNINTADAFSTVGANALTLTTTGVTDVTLPTTGTLATLNGTETLTNKTIAAGDNTITGLTNANLSGAAAITNANLANSDITIGTTAIDLGASSTTLAGLTSVTSTDFVGDLTGDVSGNATTATTATNIAGGVAGGVPYQTGIGATSLTAAGTAGQVLTSNGAGAPTWETPTVGTVTSVSGTLNRIDIDNTDAANPIVDIDANYAGQNTITTLGTVTTGTWNADIITGAYGGTGVDNGANTITIGGNINTADAFSTVGANALTLTTTGVTDVTLPTTGTLATLNGTETLTNKTIAAGDNTITGLTNANLSGAAAITNANLANSDITIGTTAIDLGASSTTLAGLTSVTSTDFVGDLTGDVSGNATTATTATNIAGGVAGGVPYQTGIGATSLTAAGTAGQVLTSNGAGAPTWETPTVGTVTSVSGTLNRIDIDNTDAANPIVDIDANYAGQNTITTLGTVTTGTWNADIITGAYGGTGVDNGANTITIGGNINTADAFSTVGANALTLTTTGVTDVTLPTTGTLATLNGTETLTNKTIAAGDNTITGLTNANLSGAAAITNANLANSDITIGTTAIDLGASSTTLAGLTSVTSTDFVGDLTGDVSGNATTATTATNIAGGVAGGVPYQTGIGATSLTAAGTAGQVLTSNGAGAPTWETPTVGTVTSVNGTLNRIAVDNTDAANPIVDIDANYAGQNTITTLGTVTTGTWNADIITGAYGGTGVDNGANTITIGGNINTADAFSTVGANALTLTTTGVTDVTLPTTGTLATLDGAETLTNKAIAAGDNTITGLTNANLSGAAAITNANLANSDITIGTTAIDLGASSTTLAGLTSVTSTDFVGDLTGDVTGNASTATTATNIAGGVAGGVPYQTGAGATSLTGAGTAGQVLTSGGAGAPTWTNATDDQTAAEVTSSAYGNIAATDVQAAIQELDDEKEGLLVNSAGLLAALSDETGSGAAVFANSPTLTTPDIGVATGTSLQLSGLTASRPVKTDGSNNLVSGQIDLASINEVTGTLPVANGGTGTITHTAHGVLIGDGTNAIKSTAVGSAGQVLQSGGAGVDPGYSTATYPSTAGAAGNIMRSNGTNFISTPINNAQFTPASPATTTSTTGVMAGLSATITPNRSGTILILISGNLYNGSNNDGVKVQIRYGSGGIPSNGDALTGTEAGGQVFWENANFDAYAPFSLNAVVTGLTVSTTYWIDLEYGSLAGNPADIGNLSISIIEL